MFDISKIFKSDEADAGTQVVQPTIFAVIVKGETVPQAVIDKIKELGFLVDAPQVVEGTTLFPQEGFAKGDMTYIRLSDDLAVATSLMKMDGNFAACCAERGFYPAISIATDIVQTEIYKAVQKSDSPSVAAEKVATVIADYGSYLKTVIGALPVSIFKMELAKSDIADLIKAELAKKETPAAPPAPPADDKKTEVAKGEGGEGEGEPAAKPDAEPAAQPDMVAFQETLLKSVGAMFDEKLAPIQSAVEEAKTLAGEAKDLAKSAKDEAEEAAEQTKNTIFGTVDVDLGRETKVKKSEGEPPLLDTGLSLMR